MSIVIGCRDVTAEFIDRLIRNDCQVTGIVTISEETANRNKVPSWVNLKSEFGETIPVYVAMSYKLDDPCDYAVLSTWKADFGLCIGWQRILPKWFLDTFKTGVFGMHACANRLPNGRGRSPINWSLIEGAKTLHAHIFKYSDQPDAGDFLVIPKLAIESHDDIHTLQQKVSILFNDAIIYYWQNLKDGTVKLYPNNSNEIERFYPKRTEADGLINWWWPLQQIVNFVRAQTRPYPGAFVNFNGNKYKIWKCAAGMEINILRDVLPGTVIETFRDGTYFVSCESGYSIHLLDHDLPKLKVGDTLN